MADGAGRDDESETVDADGTDRRDIDGTGNSDAEPQPSRPPLAIVEGRTHVENVEDFVERIDAIATSHGVTIQAFDARSIVSRRHLERAVELAHREHARGEGIARDPAVEILLYAAGRRQIERALEMGVSAGDCPAVAVVVGTDDAGRRRGADDQEAEPDNGDRDGNADDTGTDVAGAVAALEDELDPAETLGRYDEARVRDFFDVTDQELAATAGTLEDAVLERVALLVVER